MAYNVSTAMTGNSTPQRDRQREDGRCESSAAVAERPPGARAGNGPPVPAVTGRECAPTRREFRWNHGQVFVRPEPFRLRAFLFIAPGAVGRGDNAGARDRAQGRPKAEPGLSGDGEVIDPAASAPRRGSKKQKRIQKFKNKEFYHEKHRKDHGKDRWS